MYQLVFKGECAPGTDEPTARANARALFKASVDQVERMFSGRRVVIRNKLEQEQAEKYLAVLRKHGMIAHAEPMAGAAESPPSSPAEPTERPASSRPVPPPAPEPKPQASNAPAAAGDADVSSSSVPVEPGDRPNVAGEKVDAILAHSSLRVGAAHDRLSEAHEVEAPMFEHLDDWSIAPVGVTLVENEEPIPAVVPDISHLSLVEDEDKNQ
ncbi:hypothetical protein [Marinobacter sp. JSM 1782161]|uniref:hypothetical protein n=1 Tax=Marinobacter sp. JSM 1782161 TaxID=2685906 RepID=UPI001401C6E5|nr:hypothetical protein [Marinobacter sp. JSM 1782161]